MSTLQTRHIPGAEVIRELEQMLAEHCPTCGVAEAWHPRCRRCGILAGPGHSAVELVDGYCGTCTRERRKP